MILSSIVSSVIPLVVIKKILSLLNGIEQYPILFNGRSALFSDYFNGGVSMIFIAFMVIWVHFVSCHFHSPKSYELQPCAWLNFEDSTRQAHSSQPCWSEVHPVKPMGLFCLTGAEIPFQRDCRDLQYEKIDKRDSLRDDLRFCHRRIWNLSGSSCSKIRVGPI